MYEGWRKFSEFHASNKTQLVRSSKPDSKPIWELISEVGQYQIVVQYQYQYFQKFHFQYQDQYQYCP